MGGIEATIAPLSHYVHTPLASHSDAPSATRRREEATADRIANAILQNEPLDSLLE